MSSRSHGVPKAFQFIEGRPANAQQLFPDEDKENEVDGGGRDTNTGFDIAEKLEALETQLDKPFPSTPATRLPLADLIGTTDESANLLSRAGITPDEQIQWHPIRSPKSSASKRTPVPRRNKRAYSSSPSSPALQTGVAYHPSNPNARVVYEAKEELHTPQVDPAADLWTRYAINNSKDGASVVRNLSFANLMVASSPYAADDQASNLGGLRRWTSCGREWPSSKSKRRKLVHSPNRGDFVSALPAPPTLIKGASLLERIQESLARPEDQLEAADNKAPSSSSPLPEKVGLDGAASNAETPSRVGRTSSRRREYQERQATTGDQGDLNDRKLNPGGFSSDNLELGMLKDAEQAMPQHSGNTSAANDLTHTESITLERHQPVADRTSRAENDAQDSDDLGEEFDDFDNDEFSLADIEFVASAFDSKTDLDRSRQESQAVLKPTTNTTQNSIPDDVANEDDDDDDEFLDDDIDESFLNEAEIAATQSCQQVGLDKEVSDKPESRNRTIQRYLVKSVAEGDYIAANGLRQPEKVLLVEEDITKWSKTVTLRQSWLDTRCSKGSYVHIIGAFDKLGQCIVDDAQNLIILHPDHLISALVVADSFSCMRRAVLQDRIKATSEPSPPQLYGTILHELFQQCLEANQWDADFMSNLIEKLLERHIEDLYDVKLDVYQATEHLKSKMPELQGWAECYVRSEPASHGNVQDRNGKIVHMSITKLLDVEEHVWSPMYGLKGNIDATVEIKMHDETGERILTVPFEVKTGKNSSSASHRAQTALYTLLLSDRYDVSVAYGMLYYLETSQTFRIPAIRHELRHMIMQRNELACYVRERLSLPPMIKNTHACNRCFAKTSCFLYHKLSENGDGDTSGMRDKFEKEVSHLTPVHQEFFKKWDYLLTKEEVEMMKIRRELWTMVSTEREKLGRCFANVALEPGYIVDDRGGAKINKYQYTFRKRNHPNGFSFAESQLVPGEPIVISDEDGHYALARGYVTSIQKKHIRVAVDRRLHNARKRCAGFDEETNQTFSGIMQVGGCPNNQDKNEENGSAQLLYRLDKDEFSNGLASVRNNLVQIMTNDVFQAREIRKLVVDGVEPRFLASSTYDSLSMHGTGMPLNEDQRKAIDKIMAAEDYALVLGMPGTGKTTTIAQIIRALVSKGKSVLLASYTHNAVDNILLKMRSDKIGMLRLGALAKIHPEVREFATLAAEPKESIEELNKAYHEPQVVATTCLGINHQIFSERVFDYCIVDEASQITLPVCLGPIRMAKRFVLVGDHYQLPPLVQNREAQAGGLDISLFRLLCERHPGAVTTLQHQYRMNEEIMSLSNKLIYDGRLKCGSEVTATNKLKLPNMDALRQLHHPLATAVSSPSLKTCLSADSASCWLNRTLSEISPPVVFVNTDPLPAQSLEVMHGARITNPLEARILTQLVHALIHTGVPASQMGVITLYRSQLALIKSELAHTPFAPLPPSSSARASARHPSGVAPRPDHPDQVEAHTADRFQGRDKHVVLLSFVRSNDRDLVGELLRDWRRVNVAITRARSKLILVGSKKTLARGDALLRKLVDMCDENGWVVDLPGSAASPDEHAWTSPSPSSAAVIDGPQSPARTVRASQTASQDATVAGAPEKLPSSVLQNKLYSHSSSGVAQKPFRIPRKIGHTPPAKLLGASQGQSGSTEDSRIKAAGPLRPRDLRAQRPVLADLVNDILGEDAAAAVFS